MRLYDAPCRLLSILEMTVVRLFGLHSSLVNWCNVGAIFPNCLALLRPAVTGQISYLIEKYKKTSGTCIVLNRF